MKIHDYKVGDKVISFGFTCTVVGHHELAQCLVVKDDHDGKKWLADPNKCEPLRKEEKMNRNVEIARTILEQLGGGRFVSFTGSNNFRAVENGLEMHLARNASKANRLRVTLTGMDDYNMEFYRYTAPRYSTRGGEFKTYPEKVAMMKTFKGVYCDQLQELFTYATGLYTRF